MDDSPAYSIRRKTKKEVQAELDSGRYDLKTQSKPFKITVEYSSGFDLLLACVGEGGLYEEAISRSNEDLRRSGISKEELRAMGIPDVDET